MLYDRKIRYLDYYRNGERVRNGGFAKTELQGDSLKVEITLRGLPCADREAVDVILCAGEREVVFGSLGVRDGCGEFRRRCSVQKGIDGTGVEYGELDGIRLWLSETERISCVWRIPGGEKKKEELAAAEEGAEQEGRPGFFEGKSRKAKAIETVQPRQMREKTERKEKGWEGRPGREQASGLEEELWENSKGIEEQVRESSGDTIGRQTEYDGKSAERREENQRGIEEQIREIGRNTAGQQAEDDRGAGEREMHREMTEFLQESGRETGERDREEVRTEPGEQKRLSCKEARQSERTTPQEERPERLRENAGSSRQQPEAVALLEDKWLQLAAIYPHIKPFRDEREYLSVGPADFVLFSAESYRAVNNSFLLHGYYNYRHLILARVERRGEILYYVGVPGNYYDREKQVAVMFGFESFECAEEPAQNGDFGYYMMKVQI